MADAVLSAFTVLTGLDDDLPEVVDLPPLYEVLDLSVLDTLFTPGGNDTLSLEFSYVGFAVTVRADEVVVRTDDHSPRTAPETDEAGSEFATHALSRDFRWTRCARPPTLASLHSAQHRCPAGRLQLRPVVPSGRTPTWRPVGLTYLPYRIL